MMWVHEETLRDSSAKLSETINKTHVNSKYLPVRLTPLRAHGTAADVRYLATRRVW